MVNSHRMEFAFNGHSEASDVEVQLLKLWRIQRGICFDSTQSGSQRRFALESLPRASLMGDIGLRLSSRRVTLEP